MIIKGIKLSNIRSYRDEEIEFPQGSVLLSGNIGSGKSSVLLAIEFALFGLQKGMVEGNSLLRHSSKEGFVELILDINGKEIKVKRSLQRKKDAVIQDSASLSLGGEKKELTATELKDFVLDILHYPQKLLTRRNLIYRFTVYTPQEAMREILLADRETRIDTLRKVFGIDKYKIIAECCEIFLQKLKEKKKEKEGMISDLEFKQQEFGKKKNFLSSIEKNLQALEPKVSAAKKELEKTKKELEKIEEARDEFAILKNEIVKREAEEKEKSKQLKKTLEYIEELCNNIKLLEKELEKKISVEEIKQERKEKEKILEEKKQAEKKLLREISAFSAKKAMLDENMNKIEKLKTCPICMQVVSEEHKEKVVGEIKEGLRRIEKLIEEKETENKKICEENGKIEVMIKKIYEEEKKAAVFSEKEKNLDEDMKRLKREQESKKILQEEIGTLSKKLKELREKERAFENVEEKYRKIKLLLGEKQEEEKRISMEKRAFEVTASDAKKEMEETNKEIEKKLKTKEHLQYLQELQRWLEKDFLETIAFIEKQVMLKLNAEFNSFFQKWFSMLVEDESLTTKVDIDFTPTTEQQGYSIDYAYLSGGERTALALAYRLALNQVINSMLSKIATRNLLILDEPTDGFSSQQLDKMRDVLQELKAKQLIFVSHEDKIENFVEHVIRFEKKDGTTRVSY